MAASEESTCEVCWEAPPRLLICPLCQMRQCFPCLLQVLQTRPPDSALYPRPPDSALHPRPFDSSLHPRPFDSALHPVKCSRLRCGFPFDETFLSGQISSSQRLLLRKQTRLLLWHNFRQLFPAASLRLQNKLSPVTLPTATSVSSFLGERDALAMINNRMRVMCITMRENINYIFLLRVLEILKRYMSEDQMDWGWVDKWCSLDPETEAVSLHFYLEKTDYINNFYSGWMSDLVESPLFRGWTAQSMVSALEELWSSDLFLIQLRSLPSNFDLLVYSGSPRSNFGDISSTNLWYIDQFQYSERNKYLEALARRVEEARKEIYRVYERNIAEYSAYVDCRDFRGKPISYGEYLQIHLDHVLASIRNTTQNSNSVVGSSTLIFPCGQESCDGMLGANWACFKCGLPRCPKCHHQFQETNPPPHQCDPADVKSAKELMRNTRPCPQCGIRIYRDYGCDHMFCTSCHTGFNWSTGAILKGGNTNPHYHEWVRSRGHRREVECGDERAIPQEWPLILAGVAGEIPVYEVVRILDFRLMMEELRDWFDRNPVNQRALGDSELAERYVAGLCTAKKVQETLFREYRKRERERHHREIFNTLLLAGGDILRAIETGLQEKMGEHITSIQSLVMFVNRSLRDINLTLGYKAYPQISSDMGLPGGYLAGLVWRMKTQRVAFSPDSLNKNLRRVYKNSRRQFYDVYCGFLTYYVAALHMKNWGMISSDPGIRSRTSLLEMVLCEVDPQEYEVLEQDLEYNPQRIN